MWPRVKKFAEDINGVLAAEGAPGAEGEGSQGCDGKGAFRKGAPTRVVSHRAETVRPM